MYVIKHKEQELFIRSSHRLTSDIEKAKVWMKKPTTTLKWSNYKYNPNVEKKFMMETGGVWHVIEGEFEIRKVQINLV